MKKLVLFLGVIVLASCTSQQTRESIEKEIDEKRTEISELKQQITKLEEQLKTLPGQEQKKFEQLVKVKELQPEEFNHYITLNGNVEAEKGAFISPEVGGQIRRIHVKEGQWVKTGQLLVSLNTSVTLNTINEVKTQLELASKLYDKQKNLWDQKIGSEIQYLQAKTNKESLENKLKTLQAQLSMSLIKAPFYGIVDEINLKEGEMASPGMQVVQLVNLSDLKIEADISEKFIYQIKEGDKVEVSFPTYSEDAFTVPISRKGNVIEPDNRTFKIEVKLKNKNNMIKPNMLATVKVNDYSTDSALVVPSIILKKDFNGTYCYKVIQKDEAIFAKKTYVRTGKIYNDLATIEKGLSEGDEVITSGYNLVSDGARIKVQ